MASAMVETENLKADYTLGDGKTGDAFNAGRCKQNWYMVRQCHAAWNSLGASSILHLDRDEFRLEARHPGP